jgi:hypothetical protein
MHFKFFINAIPNNNSYNLQLCHVELLKKYLLGFSSDHISVYNPSVYIIWINYWQLYIWIINSIKTGKKQSGMCTMVWRQIWFYMKGLELKTGPQCLNYNFSKSFESWILIQNIFIPHCLFQSRPYGHFKLTATKDIFLAGVWIQQTQGLGLTLHTDHV